MNDLIFTSHLFSVTRRFMTVFKDGKFLVGKSITPKEDFVVGDVVECKEEKGEILILSKKERKNIFKRLYFGKIKNIASNIDRIYIVVATKPMINTSFIDNVICEATNEDIAVSIVINKSDLEDKEEKREETKKIYNDLGYDVIFSHTKSEDGIRELKDYIEKKDEEKILLCGLSGVGKSSILNMLIGDEKRRVGDLGKRGQGKQTTTQSFGYIYNGSVDNEKSGREKIIIDMPGIQNFSVSYFEKDEIRFLFSEILKYGAKCPYEDCLHIKEEDCNVKLHVEKGDIAKTRYESYLKIINEIEENKKY